VNGKQLLKEFLIQAGRTYVLSRKLLWIFLTLRRLSGLSKLCKKDLKTANELKVPRTVYIAAIQELNLLLRGRHKMTNEPVHVTDANFNEIIKNNKVALIDFWAGWCGPCRALAPTIEELARDYNGRVFVGKLDVDQNPNTAECFQVFSIPTLVVFKDGCEVERLVGLCSKNRIEEVLEKNI